MRIERLRSKYTNLVATVDRISSWIREAEEWHTKGGGEYPITETHMRGGRLISLFDAKGNFVSTQTSRTVTHLRDAEGNLKLRYVQNRPPEGYTKVQGAVIVEL